MSTQKYNLILGKNLKLLRALRSQEEMAELFGVSTATWSAWELGTREPNLETVNRFCNYFTISMDKMFGRTEFYDSDENAQLRVKATWFEMKYIESQNLLKSILEWISKAISHIKPEFENANKMNPTVDENKNPSLENEKRPRGRPTGVPSLRTAPSSASADHDSGKRPGGRPRKGGVA